MQKFKKHAKKYLLKACITSLVIVFLCISFFIPSSADTIVPGTQIFYNLDEIFYETTGDFLYVIADDQSQPTGLSKNSGYFRSVNTMPASVINLYGQVSFLRDYSDDMYYKISIPLSFWQSQSSIATLSLSLIDYSNNQFDLEVQQLRPDPKNTAFVTFLFTGTFSGKLLNDAKRFNLTCRAQSWEGYAPSYAYIGLLEGRSVEVTSISSYQYDVLYGDNDYSIDTGDTIARVDAIENELFDRADLGSITESVFGSLTWFADLSPGIMAAGMIFDELLNFGGINNTWMLNVVRFALMLGVLALLLAIGPGLMSRVGSSRSDSSHDNKKGKGDGS